MKTLSVCSLLIVLFSSCNLVDNPNIHGKYKCIDCSESSVYRTIDFKNSESAILYIDVYPYIALKYNISDGYVNIDFKGEIILLKIKDSDTLIANQRAFQGTYVKEK